MFCVEFCADVGVVGFLPCDEGVVELVVHHALFEEACHFVFAGDGEGDAFGVLDACVFHVCDDGWAFACCVYADFLDGVPSVL